MKKVLLGLVVVAACFGCSKEDSATLVENGKENVAAAGAHGAEAAADAAHATKGAADKSGSALANAAADAKNAVGGAANKVAATGDALAAKFKAEITDTNALIEAEKLEKEIQAELDLLK